jgi:hypothetical protein
MSQQSTSNQSTQKSGNSFVKTMKKALYLFVLLFILLGAAYVYWNYYYTYSDGTRAGLLQKFSRKGNLFKTYEGEMILSSVQSNINVPLASEKFLFSVSKKPVADQLSALQGDYIVVHYRQMNNTLPWRGESAYVVDSVSVSKRP